ncbi:MAG: hypothetical protein KKC78_08565 [Proteobacteria bacterium]|nr:hypothetical protein [Pseudomonadota bacterium]
MAGAKAPAPVSVSPNGKKASPMVFFWIFWVLLVNFFFYWDSLVTQSRLERVMNLWGLITN